MSFTRSFPFTMFILAGALCKASFAEHEGDVGLTIQNGHLVTNVVTEAGQWPHRVFGSTLGEFGVPGVGDEPGTDCEPGTFIAGNFNGFTIQAPLKVWNGVRWIDTAPNPLDGERLRLTYDTFSVETGDGPVDGFELAVQPNGGWHYHSVFQLLPAGGAGAPVPGAYLLELSMHTTQPDVGPTLPYWIVFNHELEETEFDSILEVAQATLGCRSDLNVDGVTDGADITIVLGEWGGTESGPGDVNDDGLVDGADITAILGDWGACGG